VQVDVYILLGCVSGPNLTSKHFDVRKIRKVCNLVAFVMPVSVPAD